jgi:hypothetical protein
LVATLKGSSLDVALSAAGMYYAITTSYKHI